MLVPRAFLHGSRIFQDEDRQVARYQMDRRMIRGQGHAPPGYSVEYDGSSDWPTDRFGRAPGFWLKYTHVSWFRACTLTGVCIYTRVTRARIDRRPLSARRRCTTRGQSYLSSTHFRLLMTLLHSIYFLRSHPFLFSIHRSPWPTARSVIGLQLISHYFSYQTF